MYMNNKLQKQKIDPVLDKNIKSGRVGCAHLFFQTSEKKKPNRNTQICAGSRFETQFRLGAQMLCPGRD